jgi:hypothetical protein
MSKLCSIGVALWSEVPKISVTTSVMCHETGMLATGTEDGTVWMWRVPASWFDSPERPAKPQQSTTGVFAHRNGGVSTKGVSLATVERPWDISATRYTPRVQTSPTHLPPPRLSLPPQWMGGNPITHVCRMLVRRGGGTWGRGAAVCPSVRRTQVVNLLPDGRV